MGWRCFLAAELPSDGLQSAADLIERLAARLPRGEVRWVHPDQLHLTLHFLGDDVSREGVGSLTAQGHVIAKRILPFAITLGSLATLPTGGPPRVIILPCRDPAGQLMRIRTAFFPTIASLGLPQDRREWLPHLTLGRVKGILGKFPELPAPGTGAQLITRLTLYRSILTPDGPQYAKLDEFHLGGL